MPKPLAYKKKFADGCFDYQTGRSIILLNGTERHLKTIFYNRLMSGVALLKKRRDLSNAIFSNHQLSEVNQFNRLSFLHLWVNLDKGCSHGGKNAHPANYLLL